MKDVPGITSKMLVKLGENEVKTVEDLAGCATDDLVGWTERKEGSEPVKHAGFLDGLDISREDAEALIMQARVKAGWITEADLAKPPEETQASEDQPAAYGRGDGPRRLAMAAPDLDNGPRTGKSAPLRMCAVSREQRPADELI